MNKLKGCFSHNSDDWSTPKDIYNHFINNLGCIDPCPLNSKINNLYHIYVNKNIYLNPPYSEINEWVKFIEKNLNYNKNIYVLIPARTDTKYFHHLMRLSADIELNFIKGRLKIGESNASAPFPSVLIKFKYSDKNTIKTNFIERNDILYYG